MEGGGVGAPFAHVPSGYRGVSLDGAEALVGAAGYNFYIADTSQEGGRRSSLVSGSETKSISASIRNSFSDKIDGFVDLFTARSDGDFYRSSVSGSWELPAGVDGNPFVQAVRVTVPVNVRSVISMPYDEDRVVVGGIFRVFSDWSVSVDHTWNETSISGSLPSLSLGPAVRGDIITGIVDVFRDIGRDFDAFSGYVQSPTTVSKSKTVLSSSSLRASGTIPINMPAGRPTVSSLVEMRKEKLRGSLSLRGDGVGLIYQPRSQSVDSAYFELAVPVFSDKNSLPFLRELSARLAVRWDAYDLVGATSDSVSPGVMPEGGSIGRKFESYNPTVSLKYAPFSGFSFRGSYGTGFLPPSLSQLVPNEPVMLNGGLYGLVDPLRGGESLGDIVFYTGGNPSLKPEESESVTAGFVFEHGSLDIFRLSMDWVKIDKKDNVFSFGLAQFAIDDELSIPGLVGRSAPSDGFPVGRIVSYSSIPINVSKQSVESIDLRASYEISTARLGSFGIDIWATRNLRNESVIISSLPVVDWLARAPKDNGSVSLDWNYNKWSINFSSRYYDSYCVSEECGVSFLGFNESVSSQLYHDFFISRSFDGVGFLSGLNLRAGVKNFTNEIPPIISTSPFYNQYGDPRLRVYFASIGLSF